METIRLEKLSSVQNFSDINTMDSSLTANSSAKSNFSIAASSLISMGSTWMSPKTMATTGGSSGSSGWATTPWRRPG